MKGASELFATFLKIMQIGYLCMTILLVFFAASDWNVTIDLQKNVRQAYSLGEAFLACSDITVTASDGFPMRGVFDETLLTSVTTPSCIRWGHSYLVKVQWATNLKSFGTGTGTTALASLPAAVKTSAGTVLGWVNIYEA